MLKKIKIEDIVRKEKTSRDGRPYTSVGLKVAGPSGMFWINGFENQTTSRWKKGDLVEIEVEKKGDYFNFKTPRFSDGLAPKIDKILQELEVIKKILVPVVENPPDTPELSDSSHPAFDPESDNDLLEKEEELPF